MQNTIIFVISGTYTLLEDSYEILGISYIQSYLKQKGYACNIYIDNNKLESEKFLEELFHDIEEKKPLIVGMSLYTENLKSIFILSKKLKDRFQDLHLTIGGPSTINCDREILERNTEIDSVIIGEGEETILDMAERLSQGRSLENCLGVTYRVETGEIRRNPSRPLIENLDAYPFADRELYEKRPSKSMRMYGHRGCMGACTFCLSGNKKIQEGPCLRFRSGKNIVDELELLNNKYGVRNFEFFEDTFIESTPEGIKKVEEFIYELKKRKLDIWFNIFARAEQISKDERYRQYLEELQEVGLDAVYVGFEAGNDTDLRLYRKRATVQDNQNSIDYLKGQKMALRFGWIMFNPYSTFETLYANTDFLNKNAQSYCMDRLTTKLEVYPGCRFREMLYADGLSSYSTDFFDDAMNYRYKDPKINELAEIINELVPSERERKMWVKLIMIEARVKRKENNEKIHNLLKEIDEFKTVRNHENSTIFKNVLDMCNAEESKIKVIDFCKEQKLQEMPIKLEQLYNRLMRAYYQLYDKHIV
ncbi:radical SAM protein [Anaerocolumna sp. AGMB13020]|uniref:B12-binding domain-containing radical SAM protein n=1 Tax=Anaerocolumna sp. AGMB13020 TaxID=3081750 RepID=UPI002955676E|nr:radical SAM protein [Anaerocolumna sp. AGMB13020]WOO34838.1 radical SAM protein [Anaerocolumna sp. AGMB13020]